MLWQDQVFGFSCRLRTTVRQGEDVLVESQLRRRWFRLVKGFQQFDPATHRRLPAR
jgi:hypothetical protein